MIIIQDTREKLPWSFISFDQCVGQIIKSLNAGDYTLDKYDKLICIERKRTVNELATNLSKKYSQFKNEMCELTKYRFKYVICEFSEQLMLIYPKGSKLPKQIQNKIRICGKFLHKRVNEIIDEFGVEFIFCKDRYEAQSKAMELLTRAKNVYDEEKRYN
jgi:hypothetical protein